MQVTVFGASGKVGRLVVRELANRGYSVVAFVHSRNAVFDEGPKLKVVTGDVHDKHAVMAAISGSEVVISSLGSWGTKTKDILSSAIVAIIPAMEAQKLSRLISLTGSGAYAPGDHLRVGDKLSHAVFNILAKKIIVDAEKHLQLLDASSLNWTVVRAPIMKNRGASSYLLNHSSPSAWETIPRQAVAAALVDQLTASDFSRSAPHIHSAK